VPIKRDYNRYLAVSYANRWWNESNPTYRHMGVDCTNFVSQCLYAGGAPMKYTGVRSLGWWYLPGNAGEPWSFSWSVANALRLYLTTARTGLRASKLAQASELQLADVICYDWNGDGVFTHNTIVTGFDSNHQPLVNAHTNNSIHRAWDYRDSYAWTPRTQYEFLHIQDFFGG
jgi:hypothetical protein